MSRFKLSDDELKFKLNELVDFIKTQRNMPQNVDQVVLQRFLKFYNGDVEKAFKRLNKSMELRKNYPNIFCNRDAMNPNMRKMIHVAEMVSLSKFTSDNCRILMLRLIDSNPESLVFDDALTVFTMMNDTMMKTPDNDQLADGEVLIFDFKGFSAGHLTKVNLSSLRCFIKYMIEAHPLRIKEVHFTNFHSWIEKFFNLVKPFLGAKALKYFHFHEPNSETLFEFIPRDLLPDIFGGTAGSIDNVKQYWIQRCIDHRNYLLDDDQWKLKELELEETSLPFDESFNYLGFC